MTDSVKLNKRETIFSLITIVVLGIVLLFTAVVDPQLKKHKSLTREIDRLQLDLTKAKNNLLIKDRIDKIYDQIEPLLDSENNQQRQISAFTRRLDMIFSYLNMKIRSVKILPTSNENYYQRISIRIEMVGHVKDFLKFIETINKHEEPIRIEQFELTAQETKDNVLASVIVSKIVREKLKSAKII
jgi:Tfp pilus assembly protein PilO